MGQTQLLTGFESIQFNPIPFYSIFIYFQQDSKAMTCLCFKLIDLFWFYCFDTIATSIHFMHISICVLGARTAKSLEESTNNTLFNCWMSIKSFERITLKFYIVMKCAVPFTEHPNTILMLICRRTNNKKTAVTHRIKESILLKSYQCEEWRFQRKRKKA